MKEIPFTDKKTQKPICSELRIKLLDENFFGDDTFFVAM